MLPRPVPTARSAPDLESTTRRRGSPGATSALALSCLLVTLLCGSCRKGSTSNVSDFLPIPSSGAGNHGCDGANQGLTPGSTLLDLDLTGTSLVLGSLSQMAAESASAGGAGTATLFVTGALATVSSFDVTDPMAALAVSETVLVSPGTVDALLGSVGIGAPAELSGLCVLSDDFLVVVENTSNTLLLVSRNTADDVDFLAGAPSTSPGFADGMGDVARFNFDRATAVLPGGDGRLFVADPGNHRIRLVEGLVSPTVTTVAGSGAPFHGDGDLAFAGFDTPVGLSVSCRGELLVVESGGSDVEGNRLRILEVGAPNVFGAGYAGRVDTLAGDGDEASTSGVDEDSSLAAPLALVSSAQGEMYWIDGATGILRRYALNTGLADCPLFVDCASAGGNFTTDGTFSTAIAANETLFVLDADAGRILAVLP